MRLKNRQVIDLEEIIKIIDDCDTVCLGLYDDEIYMVPVSYGYEVIDDKIIIYIHGAKVGRKYTCLKQSDDIHCLFYKMNGYIKKDYGFTCQYESCLAKGKVKELSGDDALHGLERLLSHCGFDDDISNCKTMPYTSVFALELYETVAKKR